MTILVYATFVFELILKVCIGSLQEDLASSAHSNYFHMNFLTIWWLRYTIIVWDKMHSTQDIPQTCLPLFLLIYDVAAPQYPLSPFAQWLNEHTPHHKVEAQHQVHPCVYLSASQLVHYNNAILS